MKSLGERLPKREYCWVRAFNASRVWTHVGASSNFIPPEGLHGACIAETCGRHDRSKAFKSVRCRSQSDRDCVVTTVDPATVAHMSFGNRLVVAVVVTDDVAVDVAVEVWVEVWVDVPVDVAVDEIVVDGVAYAQCETNPSSAPSITAFNPC